MEMTRTYALQENGQVTLPRKWRERYSLKKGDIVSFEETADGALRVLPRVTLGMQALEQLGHALKEKGVSLNDLLKSGERISQDIYDAKYKRVNTRA